MPSAGSLEYGELALNYSDGSLFYKNSANTVTVIASNQFVSVSGNVTAGNINTSGSISATGNVTGNYFIGDGSQLTGIASSGNAITNGSSNVEISVADGNVDIAVNGLSQSAQFSQGSFYVSGPIATPKVVNNISIVAANVNAVMISPVEIGPSGNIVVPASSTLTIFTP